MKGNSFIFYTPENQYPGMPHGEMCGDIMPYFHDGKYTFFFLYKYCIYAVDTEDFVHYGKCRLVLQNGSPDEQDWHAATGSVFYFGGKYYFYYTGFCEGNRGVSGKNEQAILRAISTDFYHWEKDPTFHFAPDGEKFGNVHWRDPQLFWSEKKQKVCMLITATMKDGDELRSGCTVVYESDDAEHWTFGDIIYAPGIFPTHECQDLFQMGEKWYLVFSTYSRWWETRYRIADDQSGPWNTPLLDDMFDGREFYAAKTVSDGKKRYLVGWQSIRKDCSDSKPFVWGGNVVVHELVQRPDNTLGVKMPDAIRNAFNYLSPIHAEVRSGDWEVTEKITGNCAYGFGWMKLGELSGDVLFEGKVSWKEDTQAVGLMIHTVDSACDSGKIRLSKWCQMRIEPGHGRIAVERYDQIDGDQMYLDERRISFRDRQAEVRLIVSGNIMLVYVNDVALATRCYSIKNGGIGLFTECGKSQWTDISLKGVQE